MAYGNFSMAIVDGGPKLLLSPIPQCKDIALDLILSYI